MESQTLSPIDLVISRLRRFGCDPKELGPGKWESKCPAHKGSKHNLTVTDFGNTVGLHCFHVSEHGGKSCPFEEIVKSLDLSRHDLYVKRSRATKERRKGNEEKPTYPEPDGAIAWAVRKHKCKPTSYWVYYELHDDQRFELMRVYRFDPAGEGKKCYPVHPTHKGWQSGDPSGKLPLYNLPGIIGADLAVITEGEKCADIVISMGLPATTSSHGAQSANRTDWSPLAGKKVYIIPDNDEEGEGYAQSVARLLIELNPAPEIRILHLPDLEKKWDIQEWVEEVVPNTWDLPDCAIELQRLWKDLPPWEPPPNAIPLARPQPGDDGPPKLTELGNARRLVKDHGESMRFDYVRQQWMAWESTRWALDERGRIWESAKDISRKLFEDAGKTFFSEEREALVKWGLRSQSRRVIESSIVLAKTERSVLVTPSQFDKEPSVLGAPNGVIDLMTGELLAAKPEHMISKAAKVDYDPGRSCDRWLNVLGDVFAGDDSLISYLKRAAGYSISGFTSEHAMFMCYGVGRNGKNTVLDTIRDLVGEYSSVCDPRIFLAAGQSEHPTALADLCGRRLIVTSEIDGERRLAESLVKRLTGDRTIKARFMRENWFEFEMTAKIWMLVNSKPQIHGQDEGIWSRIRVIPFDVVIPEKKRVKNLSETLIREEGPGILAWLVEGFREWHTSGLEEPEKVVKAVRSYRSEQDVLAEFLPSCFEIHKDPEVIDQYKIKSSVAYRTYADWCNEMGEKNVMTARQFYLRLTDLGFPSTGSGNNQFRCGLTLKAREPEEHLSEGRNGHAEAPELRQRPLY